MATKPSIINPSYFENSVPNSSWVSHAKLKDLSMILKMNADPNAMSLLTENINYYVSIYINTINVIRHYSDSKTIFMLDK